MGYLHIPNLYADTTILQFKQVYALEKIHGTSAHLTWKENKLSYFAGGVNHENFIKLFDEPVLVEKLMALYTDMSMTIFGEAYGGKLQGMSKTYGDKLKFVVFDIMINDLWLDVPTAEHIALELGLEFVDYVIISTDMIAIDGMAYTPSVQARRNSIYEECMREGIVLRPFIELRKNNGERIIAKHKRPEFQETTTKREIDPNKIHEKLRATNAANEWVTEMRLTHVLDKFPEPKIENTGDVIKAMLEDVYRESLSKRSFHDGQYYGEVVDDKQTRSAIGARTAKMFKERLYVLSGLSMDNLHSGKESTL